MKRQGYSDRMDERLGMKDGAESSKSQSYKSRRDESRGMMKSSAKSKNDKYMPKKMGGKVMGHDKSPYKVTVPEGQGFAQVKPFNPGKLGYPKQAFDYKY